MKQTVILIDDERAMRESIAQWLDLADCSVRTFADAQEALSLIHTDFDGVVITDLKMPAIDGMGVLDAVIAIDRDIPVVLITGHGDVNSAVEAMRVGAYDFIEKPFQPERLLSTIKRAGEKRDLVLQNRRLVQRASMGRSIEERLIGDCAAIRTIRAQITEFAAIDVNILLIGETGTGKEVIARCLHEFSPRIDKPYRAIDCGALPAERIEHSLFGELGSENNRGPFELAKGGTVLLDEVTNMPLEQQVKLLRVLEQREVQRVGEHDTQSLDIRLVSAANSSLAQLIDQQKFRTDLYFRLNTIELQLPPLRERDDDCILLFEHFSQRAAQLHKRDTPPLSSQDVTALRKHSWPGNVRELKNLAERFVLYQSDSVHDLLSPDVDKDTRKTLNAQVSAFEKSIIVYAMTQCNGQISDAADYLGLPRRTLNDKLQRHKIDREQFHE